ncbi:MBL fold metallo-hydrolase [Promicromonospora thailandica]|uniref:Glyoxylase, beta-lactamase superfamily II n=1 Tax=Promicromonospora thailandica TaxID=765201 RepID=A0A9X2G4G0_9MICO|nr:MBL fold metallo-hydrolase [Promicromonospora thailandica]MCP2266920.1 Glyoxylase, beta-lactamase superfamily II [Promicromonospora thailandica]BFF16812.1 MBL fold metallo-hydrolase [Promicromonospora thailandica]
MTINAAVDTTVTVHQLPTGTYETPAALAFRGGSFRERRQFAATAVLVRHPRGDVLVDAGFGARAEEHIRSLPPYRRSPHTLGATVSEQLDAAGYDRARLAGVLLTHSHWDHVSGLDSLDVPVLVTAQELRYAEHSRGDAVFRQVVADREVRTYEFGGPAHLGFPAAHDLYGDGAIVVVPAPGHTSGSVVVLVTTGAGVRYAFVGDLAWQLEGVTRGAQRPLLMRLLADSDPGQVRRDLDRVRALGPGTRVVPAHDLRAYEGIPRLA